MLSCSPLQCNAGCQWLGTDIHSLLSDEENVLLLRGYLARLLLTDAESAINDLKMGREDADVQEKKINDVQCMVDIMKQVTSNCESNRFLRW
jgi:hypothetical protein